MSGFERFSEGARKVLTQAQTEAQRLGQSYIDTEHILLGLAADESGIAAKVLQNLGISLNKLQAAVEFVLGRTQKHVREVDLAPRAKKVI